MARENLEHASDPGARPIEARFEWTADLLREVDRMQNRSPTGRWRWIRLFLAVVLLFALLVWTSDRTSLRAIIDAVLALAFGGLIAALGIWALIRIRGGAWRRARLANSPQLHGETHMILDASGVRSSSAHVDAAYRWSAFSSVERTDGAIGLQMGLVGWLAIPVAALDRPAEEALAAIEAWRVAGEDQNRPTVQRFE